MVGSKVQHYQFLEKLGAGGMGEIYRAQDTRLNRFVAIKVLTGTSSADPDRRRRFIQEAQAASALNHPNIITIHDILAEGDQQFMVMEHVQGKTLADLIPRGGLRVPQVLKFAMQMTDALQTAHSAGIVHRDLKPGNVMVTDTGLVKILDFGLAKLTDPGPVPQDDATRTLADAPLTMEGSIIGTVSYMSPEQAQGQKIDTRSDVFSFGVMLYEMITGTRAFQSNSTVATLTAILRDDPTPLAEVAPDIPPRLADVVERCVRKAPDDRYQTMRDVHMALGTLKHESDSGVLYRSSVMAAAEAPVASKPAKSAKKKAPAALAPAALAAEPGDKKKVMILGGGAAAVLLIGAGIWAATRSSPPATAPAPEPAAKAEPVLEPAPAVDKLTNDGIIRMMAAKVPLELIYNQIQNTPNEFVLTGAEITRMTQAGVPADLIQAMQFPDQIPELMAASAAVLPRAKTTQPPPASKDRASAKAQASGQEELKAGAKSSAKSDAKAGRATPPPEPSPATPPVVAATPTPVAPVVPRTSGSARSEPAVTVKQVVLSDASPFLIALDAAIPEDAKAGHALKFHVVQDVKVGDTVVIAKGAAAAGEIAQTKKLLFGKMTIRLLTVAGVDGKTHKIRAVSSRTEKDPQRSVDNGKKPQGQKVEADAGFEYMAYVDSDMILTVQER